MTIGGPLISIVIPTCNRPDMLRSCLDAISTCIGEIAGVPCEVLVSDDSGDDVSRRMVAEQYPWVKWIRGPRRGPACNRNTGVLASSGSWVLFTDDDCLALPGWIAAYLRAIQHSPDSMVFEGKTVADRQRRRLDEESPVNLTGGYLWSCNMVIARSVLDRLGGFCETFPYAAMEDVDLRMRLGAIGEVAAFVPDAVVCHPYRMAKGLQFAFKRGASYLHLIERHPGLLGARPLLSGFVAFLRRSWLLAKDAIQCRCRGLGFAVATHLIGTYFDVIARLRALRAR